LHRCVLSKAPVPSALLKIRRIVVKHSHNDWTTIRGQVSNATRIFYLFRPPVILLMSYIFKFSFLLMRVAEEVG
jgi:hypothetical protein